MTAERPGLGTVDALVEELAALRARRGSPSYAAIVARIAEQRVAAGVHPGVAAPGRTTVYDAFRSGRSRIDADLVREIVRALGEDEETADAWRERCRIATPAHLVPVVEGPPALGARRRAGVLGLGLTMNVLGRAVVAAVGLPLHLDMVGTAVVSIGLGPWWGALVGVATNLLGALITGPSSIPFAIVNMVGALIWGYGVRYGWGRTYARFFSLNLAVAAACTIVAAPILLLVFGGEVGHGAEGVTENIRAVSHSMVTAVLSSNLLTSIIDKVLSGSTAIAVIGLLALPPVVGRLFPSQTGS